jgi:hypothetical protein
MVVSLIIVPHFRILRKSFQNQIILGMHYFESKDPFLTLEAVKNSQPEFGRFANNSYGMADELRFALLINQLITCGIMEVLLSSKKCNIGFTTLGLASMALTLKRCGLMFITRKT